MTSPPQPHRPLITDDLDLGIDAALPVPKRQAANMRQREKALAEEAYERRRQADIERIWGRQ